MTDFLQRRWFEVFTSLVSVIAITISFWSLAVAREANNIASEANELTLAGFEPKLVGYIKQLGSSLTTTVSVQGCSYTYPEGTPYSGSVGLVYATGFNVVLRNIGLKPVSLVQMRMEDSADRMWTLKGFVDKQEQSLPVVFAPGDHKEWKIVGIDIIHFSDGEEAQLWASKDYGGYIKTERTMTITLDTDDGNRLEWAVPLYEITAYPGPIAFVDDCTETEAWLFKS